MSQTVSLRLPDATAERLRRVAKRAGRSVNEVAGRRIEESLRMGEFADIEFRDCGGERHACIKGSLKVWQFIMVARCYDFDPQRTADHFQWPVRRALAGLNYYRAFPEEIDIPLAENEAMTVEDLRRLIPDLEVITLEVEAEAAPCTA
jgi:hypothetical protein